MATREEELAAKNMLGYSIGFALAVVLTIAAYFAVANGWFHGGALVGFIITLAVVQLFVQLVLFLHLGRKGGKWNVAALLFTLMILVIIVAGSLWIMYNMNYNMQMTPAQMNEYMQKENSKGF